MSNQTRQLLGWLGGQLHDAAFAASQGTPDDVRVALVVAVALRKLSADVESMIVKRSSDIEIPSFMQAKDILGEKH